MTISDRPTTNKRTKHRKYHIKCWSAPSTIILPASPLLPGAKVSSVRRSWSYQAIIQRFCADSWSIQLSTFLVCADAADGGTTSVQVNWPVMVSQGQWFSLPPLAMVYTINLAIRCTWRRLDQVAVHVYTDHTISLLSIYTYQESMHALWIPLVKLYTQWLHYLIGNRHMALTHSLLDRLTGE